LIDIQLVCIDQVPQEHPIREYIQRIPLRRGSMVIWNSLTFHANYPNDSDRFRMVQYMRMLPVDYPYVSLMDMYRNALPAGFECSELGRKLFGFEPWP
jgi:ectoine hydroxylase-related dioxygenase (phytanoyl-CoA dioxygenase family)